MAAGGSYWQRKKPRLGQLLVRLGVLLLVVFLFWLLLAPPIAERIAHRRLRLMGLQPGEITVQHVGWSQIRIGPATLLDGRLNIQGIGIDYRLSELLAGHVRQVRIHRLQWQLVYEQGRWTTGLEQWVSRPATTETRLPIDRLFVGQSDLVLTIEGQSVLIPFELSAEQIGPQVHLAVDSSWFGRGLRGTGTMSPMGGDADMVLGFLPPDSAFRRPQARQPLDPADALLMVRWREAGDDLVHDPLSPPHPVGGRLRVRASETMLEMLGSAFGLDQPFVGLDVAWDRQGQLLNLEGVMTADAAETEFGRFPDLRLRLNLSDREVSLFGRMGDDGNALTVSAGLVQADASGGDGLTVGLRVKSDGPWTAWLDQLADRFGLALVDPDETDLSMELLADIQLGGGPPASAERGDVPGSQVVRGGRHGWMGHWSIDVPEASLVIGGLRPRAKGQNQGLDIEQMTIAFSGRAGSDGVRLDILPQSGLVGRLVEPSKRGRAPRTISVESHDWSGFFEMIGVDFRSSRLQLGAEVLRVGLDQIDAESLLIEGASLVVRPTFSADAEGFDVRWQGVEPAGIKRLTIAAVGGDRPVAADPFDEPGWIVSGGRLEIGHGRLVGTWREMNAGGLTVSAGLRSDPTVPWKLVSGDLQEVSVGSFALEATARREGSGWVMEASEIALGGVAVSNGAEPVIAWDQLTMRLPAEGEGDFGLAGLRFADFDWPAITGTWQADASGWTLRGSWPLEPGVSLVLSGRMGRALTGDGVRMGLDARLPLTRLESGGRGREILSRLPAAEGWELEGGINGQIGVQYASEGGLTSSGQIGLAWLNGKQQDAERSFKGLRGSIVLDDLLGLRSTGSQVLEASSVEVGGQLLVGAYVAFRMEGDRGVFFDRVYGNWVSPEEHGRWRERVGDGRQPLVTTDLGRLSAHAFRGRMGEPLRLELFVERFNLPAYLDSTTAGQIGGSGRFFGRLPLTLDGPRVQWFDGYLVSEPGGRFQVRDPDIRGLILATIAQGLAEHPNRQAILDHLERTLPDILYSEARIDIRGGAGPAVAQVTLRGRAVDDAPEDGESLLRFSINMGNLVR